MFKKKKEKGYKYAMKYYSPLQKKRILHYATMGMNLDDMKLSNISQSQKDKYCMIPLI